MGVFFVMARTNSACHLYDNPNTEIPLTSRRGMLTSPPRHQERPAAMQDQQPSRDAGVLAGLHSLPIGLCSIHDVSAMHRENASRRCGCAFLRRISARLGADKLPFALLLSDP